MFIFYTILYINIIIMIEMALINNKEINSLLLFNECLSVLWIEKIRDWIWLNIWTIKRWISLNRVPENYLNDLNFLLWDKYKIKNSFREKDQFYTNKSISNYCYKKTLQVLKDLEINTDQYNFIEPSAWCCNFYNILPKDKRIGIDIDPKWKLKNELIKSNYLNYVPKNNSKYIVIWNPPFGLRWNLALRFINHSLSFADVVSFILPPLFDSDWKGVPKKRVKWYKLAYTEKLPLNSFEYPNWKEVKIATIFQVWTKINTHKIKVKKQESCKKFIKVYSLSDWWTPSSTRNKKMLNICDIYLPSTCFKWMNAYLSFDELPNKRGYWIVFLKEKDKLKKLFYNEINWEKASFLSTNSALNLRTSLIEEEIIKHWFKD